MANVNQNNGRKGVIDFNTIVFCEDFLMIKPGTTIRILDGKLTLRCAVSLNGENTAAVDAAKVQITRELFYKVYGELMEHFKVIKNGIAMVAAKHSEDQLFQKDSPLMQNLNALQELLKDPF